MKNWVFILLLLLTIGCLNVGGFSDTWDNFGIFAGVTFGCSIIFMLSRSQMQKTVAIAGVVMMGLTSMQELLDIVSNYRQLFFDTAEYDLVFYLQLGGVFVISPIIGFKV